MRRAVWRGAGAAVRPPTLSLTMQLAATQETGLKFINNQKNQFQKSDVSFYFYFIRDASPSVAKPDMQQNHRTLLGSLANERIDARRGQGYRLYTSQCPPGSKAQAPHTMRRCLTSLAQEGAGTGLLSRRSWRMLCAVKPREKLRACAPRSANSPKHRRQA